MMYKTSKLARRIAEEIGIPTIKAWDVLEELGFEGQELTEKQIAQWTLIVSKKVFENNK